MIVVSFQGTTIRFLSANYHFEKCKPCPLNFENYVPLLYGMHCNVGLNAVADEWRPNSTDSLAMAKDFRSRNYILDRYRHCNSVMLPTIESIVELNKKITPALREIDLN